jgi:primosomal protein N'
MDTADLRELLADPERLRPKAFEVLGDLAVLVATDGERPVARELLVRARAQADALAPEREVLDALLRQVGLFPYLQSERLPVSDALAVEAHRPEGLDHVVFHASQAAVYRHLLAGEDVILMAPTSYGKSLIVDALIASGQYDATMIIVPSIALIDETRARLQARFGHQFRVVTHASQKRGDRVVYVMTQERALELTRTQTPALDLVVLDEPQCGRAA